jgi:hypothetical protein
VPQSKNAVNKKAAFKCLEKRPAFAFEKLSRLSFPLAHTKSVSGKNIQFEWGGENGIDCRSLSSRWAIIMISLWQLMPGKMVLSCDKSVVHIVRVQPAFSQQSLQRPLIFHLSYAPKDD